MFGFTKDEILAAIETGTEMPIKENSLSGKRMEYIATEEVAEMYSFSKQKIQPLRNEDCGIPSPILKWAGGKTQMLGSLLPRMPEKYINYIEPFLGGGRYILFKQCSFNCCGL